MSFYNGNKKLFFKIEFFSITMATTTVQFYHQLISLWILSFFILWKKEIYLRFDFFPQLSFNRNIISNHKSQITIDDLLLMMNNNISILQIHVIFKWIINFWSFTTSYCFIKHCVSLSYINEIYLRPFNLFMIQFYFTYNSKNSIFFFLLNIHTIHLFICSTHKILSHKLNLFFHYS